MADLYLRLIQLIFWMWSSTYVCLAELNSCSAVKSEYVRQGFRDSVPEYPVPGKFYPHFVSLRENLMRSSIPLLTFSPNAAPPLAHCTVLNRGLYFIVSNFHV